MSPAKFALSALSGAPSVRLAAPFPREAPKKQSVIVSLEPISEPPGGGAGGGPGKGRENSGLSSDLNLPVSYENGRQARCFEPQSSFLARR
jgi:hypothetical protein